MSRETVSRGRGAKRDRESSTETVTLISEAAYLQVCSVAQFVQAGNGAR